MSNHGSPGVSHGGYVKPVGTYSTLNEVLRERAREREDGRAFTFLVDGEGVTLDMTFGELDRRARAVAAMLQERCAPGERALLVYEPGLDYIAAYFGCLYAGVMAVPAYPPEPMRLEKTLPRLQVIAGDSDSALVLTSSMVLPLRDAFVEMNPGTHAKEWLNTAEVHLSAAEQWVEPRISGDTVAFLQYTSGSTTSPRGVMVTHDNLVENTATSCVTGGYTADSVFFSWLPQYHDMGLIGGIMQPLYGGFLGLLMSPMTFLQKPYRWLKALSDYKVRTTAFPNFALDLCVRKVTEEQRDSLDLSSLRLAVNGSEPIRPESLERFTKYFAPCGFSHEAHCTGYGLAEATLVVTFASVPDAPALATVEAAALEKHRVVVASPQKEGTRTLVGCGKTLGDTRVVIVNPQTCVACGPDEVGEIWVSGSSLALGYWNRPEETERTFRARLADTGEGPFLRTGDLGFLIHGELYVAGRLKDLIIVDGLNHYPQDIEATLEQCDAAVRPGGSAAFAVDVEGVERLVVAAEVSDARPTGKELAALFRKEISARHDLRLHDVVLLSPRSLPKTSSGKVQRHAARDGYLAGTLDVVET